MSIELRDLPNWPAALSLEEGPAYLGLKSFVIASVVAIVMAGCSAPEPETPPADPIEEINRMDPPVPAASAGPSAEAIESATAAIKAEPKVKDMTYKGDETVQWQIGVLDDGSKRVGYAQYICQLLGEHKALAGPTHVRIVDIAKVSQGEDFRSASLGHVICETGEMLTP